MNYKSNEDFQAMINLLNDIETKMLNNVLYRAFNTLILCWSLGALMNLPTNLYS